MIPSLIKYLQTPVQTNRNLLADLSDDNRGLPILTDSPCHHTEGCTLCAEECVASAIVLQQDREPHVTLDLGACIACGRCTDVCPTGTITVSRSTRRAVTRRDDLVLKSGDIVPVPVLASKSPFRNSMVVRYVSTGDNATDMEVGACQNPIFDVGRFGIQFTASPRFADALLIGGPVPLAMQQPLRLCLDAMAEPKVVIAVGTQAITGGLLRGRYARANGVTTVVEPDVWIPGNPPHPWLIIHGLLLAMGNPLVITP